VVSRENFNIMSWSMAVPLCDDLWVGMQLRNIASVDFSVIRNIEAEALEEWFRTERTPSHILMVLSGLSQMWICHRPGLRKPQG
jgi:hypothetical protein